MRSLEEIIKEEQTDIEERITQQDARKASQVKQHLVSLHNTLGARGVTLSMTDIDVIAEELGRKL